MIKTVKITKEHVETALKEVNSAEGSWISRCCVIFHGLKSADIPVTGVGLAVAVLDDGNEIELPEPARQVTSLLPTQWDSIKPFEFQVEIPDNVKLIAQE